MASAGIVTYTQLVTTVIPLLAFSVLYTFHYTHLYNIPMYAQCSSYWLTIPLVTLTLAYYQTFCSFL